MKIIEEVSIPKKCPRCNKPNIEVFYEKKDSGEMSKRFKCLSCHYHHIPGTIY